MAMEGTEGRSAVTLLWRIENLGHWEPEFHEREIISDVFRVRTLDGKKWYLRLVPMVGNKDDKRIRLGLRLVDEALNYPIDCEYSILDSDGLSLVTGSVWDQVIQRYATIVLPDCPTHEEVFVTRKSSFLPNDTLTVRCRIWKSRGVLERAQHISLLSRIEVRESSFVWPIERFGSLQLGQKVSTPVDLLLTRVDEEFILSFSLTYGSLMNPSVIFEITANHNWQELFVKLEVSVLDDGQKGTKCVEDKHTFVGSDREQTWIVSKFVSRQELLKKMSDSLDRDALTLLCEFTTARRNLSKSIERNDCEPSKRKREIVRKAFSDVSCQTSQQRDNPPQVSQQRSDSMTLLGEDFLYLYQEQTFSDFELSSEDVSFPVHKNVLSARSPVFRAMFSSDMKESNSDFLDVPDLDAHTLNRMLTFLYTGTVEHLQWEGAAKLYYAADKYQVSSLKQLCTSNLRSNITMSNVCDILVLADRHQDQELTSVVHDFILSHYDELMHSKEWENFLDNDPPFAGKTMHELFKKKYQFSKNEPS